MSNTENVKNKYSGLVWILSSVSLVIYGVLALSNQSIPGIEQLVFYMSTINGAYIFGAAFLVMLIEGLYLVGSFFPGSSLVVILAILSQAGGSVSFLLVIFAIFLGWSIAGIINIFFAKIYHSIILKQVHNPNYLVIDRPLTTWFPSFRANYEVTQIVEGAEIYRVFISSVKVKLYISLVMLGITFVLPYIIDINDINNEEGFITLFVIAAISFVVGMVKIINSSRTQKLASVTVY